MEFRQVGSTVYDTRGRVGQYRCLRMLLMVSGEWALLGVTHSDGSVELATEDTRDQAMDAAVEFVQRRLLDAIDGV